MSPAFWVQVYTLFNPFGSCENSLVYQSFMWLPDRIVAYIVEAL